VTNAYSTPHRWAVHPQPLPDETLTSWLTRVARANASTLSSWLATVYGSDTWPREQNLDTNPSPEFWGRIAECTAITGGVAAVCAMSFAVLPERVASWLLTAGRAAKERRARWCPRCLQADAEPHFRRAWRWEWVAWCPRDGLRLHDACPGCGAVLNYQVVPWRRALTECWKCRADLTRAEPDATPAPEIVRTAASAALGHLTSLTPDDVDALWCLQRFVRLVGWQRKDGTFVPPTFVAADFPTYPAMSPGAIATSFALAWHLFTVGRTDLPTLVQQHQGSFNQAIQYRCPAWLRAFHRPVRRRLEPLTTALITAAVERLRAEGLPIHYASVAEVLGRDDHAITKRPAWRAIVDAAAPPSVGPRARLGRLRRKGRYRVQPQWVNAVAARIAEARARLEAQNKPPTRAAIARETGIDVAVLERYERLTRRRLVGLAAERRLEKVRGAVAILQAHGSRVNVLAVARLLNWNRSTIERQPDLKAAVCAAMNSPLTPDEVTAAIRVVTARGERVTTLGIARELKRERDQIERRPELKALVKTAQAQKRRDIADRVKAAVADLQRRGEVVTFRAVASALGKDEHFFERAAQATMRTIVLAAKRASSTTPAG